MQETTHEYALRIARGCARGIALGDFNEFKEALRNSVRLETETMTTGTRRELREAFDAFTSKDFVDLFTGSAYRPETDSPERRQDALTKIRAEIRELQLGALPDGDTGVKVSWITNRVTSAELALRGSEPWLSPEDQKYLRRWLDAARKCRYAELDAGVECPA